MHKITNPRTEALAFRIWVYATEREWNVSAKDLAELTGESWRSIVGIARAKGWLHRLRKDSDNSSFGALYHRTDAGFAGSSTRETIRDVTGKVGAQW